MRSKRLLAMLLTLTMVVSGVPSAAIAAEMEAPAQAEEQQYNDVEAQDSVEDGEAAEITEVPAESQEEAAASAEAVSEEETPAAAEAPETEEAPAQTEEAPAQAEEAPAQAEEAEVMTFEGRANGVNVYVEAPAGAFAEGTVMTVKKASAQEVIDAINDTEEVDIEVKSVKAVDITFTDANGEAQPKLPINVKLTSDLVAETEAPIVVHVDDEGVAEEMTEVQAVEGEDDAIEFEAEHFSVYAIVETGSTDEEARATVNFWKDVDKTESREQVFVKNSDTADELVKIIYDPGVGSLESGQVFRGWTTDPNYTGDTKPKTVADIRTEMEAMEITEGDVVDYYAMIFQIYNVAFQDEFQATIKTDVIYIRADGERPSYTIKEDYVPADPDKNFDGWNVSVGSDKVEASIPTPYPKNTTVTISGDVVFSVNAPSGAWLSFNENGRGASYTAPQFVPNGAVTTRPADPTRRGYTFGGWYTDEACTNAFTFGNELSARTDVYAKWVPASTASYNVIIWKQRVSDDKNASDANKTYDVAEVITLNGNVGSTINVVTQPNTNSNVNTGRGSSVRNYSVNGSQKSYTGFHAARYDQGITISPEGTSIVNVYYDRNLITISFNTNSTSRYIYDSLTQRYVRSISYTGLYEAPLSFEWPSKYWSNSSGSGNATNTLWRNDSNNGGAILVFYGSFKTSVETRVADNLTLATAGNIPIRFYQQNPDGSWPDANGYKDIAYTTGGTFTFRNKYLGFEVSAYKTSDYTTSDNGWNTTQANTRCPSTSYSQLNIRYTRLKYAINYFDGTYFDGNGSVLQQATKEHLHTSEEIFYEASTTSYNEGGANYYIPTAPAGYSFAGWYIDSTCTKPYTFTTMPDGGITVYAKWVQIQYRVFLHPNVPETDTLEWGQTNQQMNFRVTAGDKISGGNVVNGEREGGRYELIGWFTDPSLSNASHFYFDTELTDSTVPAEPVYDKTKDFTDTMNKYGRITDAGSNSDVNRAWITRKLDLYAKWREILPGAKGINVVYDPGDGYGEPNDTLEYLDNSEAIAQAASKPNDTVKQFKGWVLQTWDGNAYVPKTGTIINPGDPFTVLKADAKVEPRLDDEGNPMYDENGDPLYTYTVKLLAEYEEFEEPVPTHITWYDNFTESPAPIVNYITNEPIKINQAVDILAADTFTREGYKFLGWAKVDTTDEEGNPKPGYTLKPVELGEGDLFLKYVEASDDGEEAHFETTDGTTVTQVAADEVYPYNDLYAVWDKLPVFYVYHSGEDGGNIETVVIESPDMTYDLTQNLTEDTLYGGYYLEGDFTAPAEVDEKIPKYNGTNWTWTTAQTDDGSDITPVADITYYIKEVPTWYLLPYMQYSYTKSDMSIKALILISAVDDLKYKETGYVLEADDQKANVASSIKVVNTVGSNAVTLRASTVFRSKGITKGGYLTYWNATDNETFFGENKEFKMTPYWITKDGIKVIGTVTRTISTGNMTKGDGGLSKIDEPNR